MKKYGSSARGGDINVPENEANVTGNVHGGRQIQREAMEG